MPRVSKDVQEKAKQLVGLLPSEVKGKCTLCNETLTHFANKLSADSGAPVGTIVKLMADEFNKTALPQDQVDPHALNMKRLRHEKDVKITKRDNKPSPEPTTWTCTKCGHSYPMDVETCGFCANADGGDVGDGPLEVDFIRPEGLYKEALDFIFKTVKRAAAKKFHPDVNPDGEGMMVEINRIMDELTNYFSYKEE